MNDTFDYHFHGELGLLAEREGEASIPVLKQALSDPDPKTRWAAADLLGGLNDRSGLDQTRKDFGAFSTDQGHVLELARVLAKSGDSTGYELAKDLAINGSAQERWRAAVALAHLANINQAALDSAGQDPVGVLKIVAAGERDEGVFFVFIDQVHKILMDRSDMIEIFAIAKESEHHSEPPPGNRFTIAEIFHQVAVRDKDNTWR